MVRLGSTLAAGVLALAPLAPASAAGTVTIVSPVAGTQVSGDVTVQVQSTAGGVVVGFLSTDDPVMGTYQTFVPVQNGAGEATLNTRGVPPSADIFACEAHAAGSCDGPVTTVDVTPTNPPVLADLRDGDILTPDTAVTVTNPFGDGMVWLGAGVWAVNQVGTKTLWFVRADLSPFPGGTVTLADLAYPGPLGGGDYEIRAGGCEPGSTPIWCHGAGTHALVAVDAPLREGLAFGTYRPDTHEWLIGLLRLQETADATVSVTDAAGAPVITDRPVGTLQVGSAPGAEFWLPAVGDEGQPLPDGHYFLTVAVDRDSVYAATPLHFHGSETIRVGVDHVPPQILHQSLSRRTLTLVPDRPVQHSHVTVDTDGPTEFTYSLTNTAGDQVWGRTIIPAPDDTIDSFDLTGWWDPAHPASDHAVDPLPPGDYTLRLHVRDRFNNTADYLLDTLHIRSGHWAYATSHQVLTPRASQIARSLAPCTSVRSPARPGWPGSATYTSAARCPRGDGIAQTRHRAALPTTPYRVVSARVDAVGGAHPGSPGSTAQLRALGARHSPRVDWVDLAAPLSRHRGSSLTADQLSGLPTLTWLARVSSGSAYDLKAFVLTTRYERAIIPD